MILPVEDYIDVVRTAIQEDIGTGDLSTECLDLADLKGRAIIRAKEQGVIAGVFVAESVFRELDENLCVESAVEEGKVVSAGDTVAVFSGNAASLLTGERVALNFLQRMSGIATLAYRYSRTIRGSKAVVTDTRKTTPGLRNIEKYSVRAGGGQNHRMGLYDAILLKDNHIDLAGGIANAVSRARNKYGDSYEIEIETRNLEEVQQSVDAGADIIMLDNMSLEMLQEAIDIIDNKAKIEVSGNVSLLSISYIAQLDVDIISVGSLTHSPDALDLSMKFEIVTNDN